MNGAVAREEKRELTAYEKKLLVFFLKCIGSELSKIIIFSIIYYLLGLSLEFLAALFFLMLYRTSSGGLHCHSYLSCLCVSFIILSSGIALGVYVHLPIAIVVVTTPVMAVFGYLLSPVQAKTRPPLEERLVLRAKRRTFFSIMFYLVLLFVFSLNLYTNIGFWLLVLHIVQLYIAKMLRR